MHATLRLAAAAGLITALAGCYGAPVTDQPVAAAGAPEAGYRCYAGTYVCNLPQPGQIGTGCSCPGLGAPSYGTIR